MPGITSGPGPREYDASSEIHLDHIAMADEHLCCEEGLTLVVQFGDESQDWISQTLELLQQITEVLVRHIGWYGMVNGREIPAHIQ